MSELKEKLQQFTNDIEENIENEKDVTYVKEKVSELCMFFLDEMERIIDIEEKKVRNVAIKQKDLEEKISKIQKSLDNIEKDIYIEDEECYDYEILCPYCGNEFIASNSEDETEVECPECNNIIELDWSGEEEHEGCSGSCSHCSGCHDEEIEDDEENNEDM